LVEAAAAGDRSAVARLISLVERGGEVAREVGRLTHPRGGTAYTVGITGAPGSGKSTLTDRLIRLVRRSGLEVGVLAVDPSSPLTGGAILGDRVRMQAHALDKGVFIRSMASRGHLGGLSLAAPEAVRVLDAAGLPLVLVETVGVGQVEIEVAGATDTTVVVLTAGWGDAVQAHKAGLLEIADVFVVNKADRPGARETQRDLDQMLDLGPTPGWRPPVVLTKALLDEGVEELWAAITRHRAYLEANGLLRERRWRRAAGELREIVARRLEQRADELCAGAEFERLQAAVLERALDPWEAAERLLAGLDRPQPERAAG
jgi:LAO/AO transport system kinase